MTSSREILDYWFAKPEPSQAYLQSRGALWFGGSEKVDREIESKFGEAVSLAAAGQLEAWRQAADSCLALILLLDQFPLNIFRDQARGYLLSEMSIPIALYALSSGFHHCLHPVQKCFIYLPLEHAEDLSLQEESVKLFRELENETRGTFWAKWAADSREWAERHLRVVQEFGRFPHRNAALGRTSTQAEIEFLKKGLPF